MKLSLASLLSIPVASSRKPAPPAAPNSAEMAPGTRIRYDADLIPRLTEHHDAIRDLLAQLRQSARARKYRLTERQVHQLRAVFTEHLLEENRCFYSYVGHCLADTRNGSALVREMAGDMGQIGRDTGRFICHYGQQGVQAETASAFLRELAIITRRLEKRMMHEEGSLFSLYGPPAKIRAAAQ